MPTRSRSHQLEDLSVREFERLLPIQWVVRRKASDYGVDLEVEIFDEDGRATGLLFFVQLKATDDRKLERSVRIDVDRIEYLSSLPVPSMIARYCSLTGQFHWQWISNVIALHERPATKTMTIAFDPSDKWANATPRAIRHTLLVSRTLHSSSRHLPIGLNIDAEKTDPKVSFILNHGIAQIRDANPSIVSNTDPISCLPIRAWICEGMLVVAIDMIASITVRLEEAKTSEIVAETAYALAYMAGRHKFSAQMHELARFISDRGLVTKSRKIAAEVAVFVLESPSVASEIARINRIHEIQDESYAIYVSSLIGSKIPIELRLTATTSFYQDAISSDVGGDASRAALNYSLANFLYNHGSYLKAIKHYNIARKSYPDYCDRPYFLNELGASFFFGGKYRESASSYALSYEKKPDSQVAICAGDAFLYSGDFASAERFYSAVSDASEEFQIADAALKGWLVGWIDFFWRQNNLSDHSVLAKPDFWHTVLSEQIEVKGYHHALGACLMVAFAFESDVEMWSNAVAMAANTSDSSLVVATLSCAVWRCGFEAYVPFREQLVSMHIPPDHVQAFDETVNHIHELRISNRKSHVTIRGPAEQHYDTALEVEADDQR